MNEYFGSYWQKRIPVFRSEWRSIFWVTTRVRGPISQQRSALETRGTDGWKRLDLQTKRIFDFQKLSSKSSMRYLRLKIRDHIQRICETEILNFIFACDGTKIAIVLPNFNQFWTSCTLNRCFLTWQLNKHVSR